MGLPTIIGRSKKVIFAAIKERIWNKLQGWKEKLLSKPGKEVLIKVVAQAIPTYMMSIFRIPDGLIDEIHSIIARFWWGSNDTRQTMHWQSWDAMCEPIAMGGMGFRNLKVFNQALLAKQMWRLQMDTTSLLHSVLKARYFKHDSVLEARRGFDPSYSWRSLWGAKVLLLERLQWRVGDGADIKVWEHGWVIGKEGPPTPKSLQVMNSITFVADCINRERMEWNARVVRSCFEEDDSKLILQMPLSLIPRKDIMYWKHSKYGTYNVKAGYWVGMLGSQRVGDNADATLWRIVWGLGGPPKLAHFVWLACKELMAVKEVLYRRHIAQDELCCCCGVEVESINHVLFECDSIKRVWEDSKYVAILAETPEGSVAAKLVWWASKIRREEVREIMTITWAIWFCRNKYVYAHESLNAQGMAASFLHMVAEFISYKQKVSFSLAQSGPSASAAQWKSPLHGTLKINIDAHVVEGRYANLGVVVRNDAGTITLVAVKRMEGRWEADLAEAAAARYGLIVARRYGFEDIYMA